MGQMLRQNGSVSYEFNGCAAHFGGLGTRYLFGLLPVAGTVDLSLRACLSTPIQVRGLLLVASIPIGLLAVAGTA